MFCIGKLEELGPGDPPVLPVEDFSLAWVSKSDKDPYSQAVTVPVYLTSSREKLVTELRLPCSDQDESAWTIRGIALQIED